MDLSGYEALVLDGHGYYVDGITRRATMAEVRSAAEQKYDAKGWVYTWRDDTRMWAHHPDREYNTEYLRIYELDAKGRALT